VIHCPSEELTVFAYPIYFFQQRTRGLHSPAIGIYTKREPGHGSIHPSWVRQTELYVPHHGGAMPNTSPTSAAADCLSPRHHGHRYHGQVCSRREEYVSPI
jgi:hypothetical protein